MGLDTSHDAWHGAYSAFTRWRNTIAKAAGYAVWKVTYENGMTMDTVMLDWGHITEDNLHGKWERVPDDPLVILLAHSDCDGEIAAEHCAVLADRLEELLPSLPDADMGGHIGDLLPKTAQFIKGLRYAAAAGEPVDFH